MPLFQMVFYMLQSTDSGESLVWGQLMLPEKSQVHEVVGSPPLPPAKSKEAQALQYHPVQTPA